MLEAAEADAVDESEQQKAKLIDTTGAGKK